MKKVRIKITDAYGIGKLDHEFDFNFSTSPGSSHTKEEHSQTNIVYARNGTMKTSLAKALDNFSHRQPISDAVYGRSAEVEIIADGTPLVAESIFVVKSEEEYFESEGMSLLLADSARQERYAEIIADLDAAQSELFEACGRAIGIRGGFEKSIERFDADFNTKAEDRLATLLSIKHEVETARHEYGGIDYKIVTEKKITDFLDKTSTQIMLKDYVDIYQRILANSEYFKDGSFDYLNAFSVQKSLNENNFMKSGVDNWVVLTKKDGTTEEVKTIDDLREKYEADKNRIFKTLKKQEEYQKFDEALGKNAELRSLQSWARKHKELVPYLQNYKNTRKQIWFIQFLQHKESYENFINVYETHESELNGLIKASRDLETEWRKVVKDFKDSFQPPFDMDVSNQVDVILKQERPVIVLKYIDDRGGIERELTADILYRHVLSKGERRALYILCVMFELHMRILSGKESLIVFDDIADSFDYRNKYAIIEYLHDISLNSTNKVHMILLTHNYDFFRAFRLRCSIHWSRSSKALEAHRKRGVITLTSGVYTNEFKRIKTESAGDMNAMLTLIPLVRNIIEYGKSSRDPDFLNLTSVLHVKSDSNAFDMTSVCNIIERYIFGIDLSAHKNNVTAQQVILDVAEVIAANHEDKMEHKVILSMATRILAERYIKDRFVTDGKIISECNEQTGRWTGEFAQAYPTDAVTLKILRLVNIVTPELLHVNAFMYEPIIDMSAEEVARVYTSVRNL